MGGGGTIAEGIRRLFQRGRSSTTSSSKHNNNNNNNNNDDRVFVKDLRSQLANIPTTTHHDHPPPAAQSLSNIKVPIYAPFPSSSSMDPNKKVFSSSFIIIGLDLRLFVFIIVPSLTNQSIIDTFNKYATERPNATDYVNSTNKLHQLGDLIESESQHTQFAPPHMFTSWIGWTIIRVSSSSALHPNLTTSIHSITHISFY
jgi:hypothetical protein